MKESAGFTLIEILVAVIILAGGLLGLASLQVTSLSNNQNAYNRSQAAQLAYDIADRMRGNSSAAANYIIDQAALSAILCPGGSNPCSACSSSGSQCNSTQLAQKDLYDWKTALNSTFVGGTGSITGVGGNYTITINWSEKEQSSVSTKTFSIRFRL